MILDRFEKTTDDSSFFRDKISKGIYYIDYAVNAPKDSLPLEKLRDRIVELLNEHGVE